MIRSYDLTAPVTFNWCGLAWNGTARYVYTAPQPGGVGPAYAATAELMGLTLTSAVDARGNWLVAGRHAPVTINVRLMPDNILEAIERDLVSTNGGHNDDA